MPASTARSASFWACNVLNCNPPPGVRVARFLFFLLFLFVLLCRGCECARPESPSWNKNSTELSDPAASLVNSRRNLEYETCPSETPTRLSWNSCAMALRFTTVNGVSVVANNGKLHAASMGNRGGNRAAPTLPRIAARENRLSATEPHSLTNMTSTSRLTRGGPTTFEKARTLRCVACAFVADVQELVKKIALSTVGKLIPNPDVSVVANNTLYSRLSTGSSNDAMMRRRSS
mmetsp:Transcript_8631/g.29036  ORF Transcript_8631/g.29036 Transcript_8631/m.29036 type:complete len:233 (+) Transcript_8631:775-1473(+)